MNKSRVVIALVAGGLGFFLGLRSHSGHARGEDAAAPPALQAQPDLTSASTASGRDSWTWPQWNGTDPMKFIRRLQDSGCPSTLLQDMVIAEINKETARLITAHQQSATSPASPSTNQTLATIRSGRIAELIGLLGSSITATDSLIGLPYIEQSKLTEATGGLFSNILRRKETRQSQIRAQAHGFLTQEDKKLMAVAEREAEIELQRALTPEEFRNYRIEQFRASDFGRALETNFGATKDELDAIDEYTRARAGLDSKLDTDPAQEQNLAALEARLGAERFDRFMQFKDPAYQEAAAFAQHFNLDPAVVDQIIQLRNAAQMSAVQVTGPAFNLEDASNMYRTRSQVLRDRLAQIVGAQAADVYLRDAAQADWAH